LTICQTSLVTQSQSLSHKGKERLSELEQQYQERADALKEFVSDNMPSRELHDHPQL
jgi:hypothetical protein